MATSEPPRREGEESKQSALEAAYRAYLQCVKAYWEHLDVDAIDLKPFMQQSQCAMPCAAFPCTQQGPMAQFYIACAACTSGITCSKGITCSFGAACTGGITCSYSAPCCGITCSYSAASCGGITCSYGAACTGGITCSYGGMPGPGGTYGPPGPHH